MGFSSAFASFASIAGAGLKASGTLLQARGTQVANEYSAQKLETAAKYGEVKAVQTGAVMTQQLNETLGNIDVIRAAAHTDPTSPTGAAVRDYQEKVGIEQRTVSVDNILAQVSQQESEAAYLRKAGSDAMLAGEIGAAGGLLGAFGKSLKSA